MSEAKPYEFEVVHQDGSKEVVKADQVEAVPVVTWVFRKDGQIVRRIPKDEIKQEPKPSYPMTDAEAAEWMRRGREIEAQNPRPRHQRPRE